MPTSETPRALPRYLRDGEGQPLRLPAEARGPLVCPLCGAALVRTPSGYLACGRHLHGRLRSVQAVVEDLRPLLAGVLRARAYRHPRALVRHLTTLLPPPPCDLVKEETHAPDQDAGAGSDAKRRRRTKQ